MPHLLQPRIRAHVRSTALAGFLFASLASPSHALNFNFISTPTMDAQALSGFQAAGDFWSSVFNDTMTINLNVDYRALNPGVLGQAGSSRTAVSYTNFFNALSADRTTPDDFDAVAMLNPGSKFDLLINRTAENPFGAGSATPYVDNDNDRNNRTILATTANLKALGLANPFGTAIDASIAFSSAFNWDFDRSNGITAGTFDFFAVAVHEIGHALGFVSGVDSVDASRPNTDGIFPSETAFLLAPLDLYRYSAESAALGLNDFTADTRPKYFSLDRGATDLGRFSTGRINGDRNQASHWYSQNPSLGIMDPSIAPGERPEVTILDLRAFDIIGYNPTYDPPPFTPVPEPATYGLGGAALLALVIYRPRRVA